MRRARGVTTPGDELVDGLNQHERLARLEGECLRAAALEQRIQELESAVRRLQMPWYVRRLAGLRKGE